VSGSVVVATPCASATNSAWAVNAAAKGNVVNTASNLWCVTELFEIAFVWLGGMWAFEGVLVVWCVGI
jgi:hypothetical protein